MLSFWYSSKAHSNQTLRFWKCGLRGKLCVGVSSAQAGLTLENIISCELMKCRQKLHSLSYTHYCFQVLRGDLKGTILGTSNLIFLGCLCFNEGSDPLKGDPGNRAQNQVCQTPQVWAEHHLPLLCHLHKGFFLIPPSTGRSITFPQMRMMSRRTQGFMVVAMCVWIKFWQKTGLQMLLEAEKKLSRE